MHKKLMHDKYVTIHTCTKHDGVYLLFPVLDTLVPTEIFQPGSSRRGSLQWNPLYVFEG